MPDVVAIDHGHASVGIARWSGVDLCVDRAQAGPDAEWDEWLRRVRASPPFDVVYRTTRTATRDGGVCVDAVIVDAARRHGARSVRIVTDDPAGEPGLAAARAAADRLGIGAIFTLEIGAHRMLVAAVDRRGEVVAYETGRLGTVDSPKTDPIVEALRRVTALTRAGANPRHGVLVCYGGRGPAAGAAVAEACGISTVLVPTYAGTLGAVGLLLANIVVRVRRDLEPAALRMTDLRQAMAQAMDAAASAITRAGYDLDDADCERYVALAAAGTSERRVVRCESWTSEDELRREIERAAAGGEPTEDPVGLLGVEVRAVIHTPKPALPPPAASSHMTADRNAGERLAGTSPGAPAEWNRDALRPGDVVNGPVEIHELGAVTVVPDGWQAAVQAAGDLVISRRSPQQVEPTVRQ